MEVPAEVELITACYYKHLLRKSYAEVPEGRLSPKVVVDLLLAQIRIR